MKKDLPDDYEKFSKTEKFKKPKKRRSSESAALVGSFEVDQNRWDELLKGEFFRARVVEVHKRYAFISPETSDRNIDTKDVWIGTVARKYLQAERLERNLVSVGDIILCKSGMDEVGEISQELPQCTIEHRLERRCMIFRQDPMVPERRHVLASNVDRLIIVASYLNPTVKWGLIDRYLVLAESQNLEVTIVLNKQDLLDSCQKKKFVDDCHARIKVYKKIGYPVLSIIAASENAMGADLLKELKGLFIDQISLVSGHSGVGKSSIANLLRPEIEQDVEDDSILYKGRHTTTYASLIRLGTGGYIVDTPGIRSFTIEERGPIELSWCFVEMRPFLGQCKYRECRHIEEPDCAIRQAVKDDKISEWRYKSYIAILTGASGREGRLRDIQV